MVTSSDHPEEPSREDRILLALDDVRNGTKLRKAARDRDVPLSTLWYRHKGLRRSRQEAHVDEQFLSPAQESVLEEWCLYIASTGQPLNQVDLRAKAMICEINNKAGCKVLKTTGTVTLLRNNVLTYLQTDSNSLPETLGDHLSDKDNSDAGSESSHSGLPAQKRRRITQ